MNRQSDIPEIISDYFFQQEISLQTTTREPFNVPESGSIGLLALGFRGLIAWRKKKLELQNLIIENEKISQ